jgi:uncharacterized protein (TIGR01244 family)
MQEAMRLSENLTVGAQPSEEQLKQLAGQGVKSIVNLRTEGEDEQPFSPEEEGEKVRALGMQYLHIPVSSKAPRPEQVDQFRSELPRLPGPVFVHCHKGKRAGAFAMMHMAVESGMSGDDTLEQAEQMGFECDSPALKDFVRGYVDQNRTD